jgi:hypothetical protein
VAPPPKLRERLAWAAIAVSTAAAMVSALRQERPAPPPFRITVDTPENGSMPLFRGPSVSPGGESVPLPVTDPAIHNTVVYLHSLATRTSGALPGTDGADVVSGRSTAGPF